MARTVDIYDLLLVTSTKQAYLVRTEDGEEVWIPRSQIEYIEFGATLTDDSNDQPVKEIKIMEIPEWLAEDKNLI